MTKEWDLVKDNIVELIKSGASLEQVRIELERGHGFQASTRSYRKKLKQWRLTRVGQFKAAQATEQSSTPMIPPTVPQIHVQTTLTEDGSIDQRRESSNYLAASPTATSATLRASLAPEEERLPRDDDRLSPHAAMRSREPALLTSTSPTDSAVDSRDWLERAYRAIEEAQTGPEVASALEEVKSRSTSSTDSLLLPAVEKGNIWLLDYLLEEAANNLIPTELADDMKSMALERAIEIGQADVVEFLLSRGASFEGDGGSTWRPLHSAAARSFSPSVCRALLRYGAKVNAHQSKAPGLAETPLRIAVDRALSMPTGPQKDKLSAMIDVMLAYGADFSMEKDDDRLGVISFLYAWTQWDNGTKANTSHGFLIGHYFRVDCNPLCWVPRSYCKECNMLASYVFAHTNRDLGVRLIESSDTGRYGYDLASLIISPCKKSSALATDTWLISLFACLLRRSTEIPAPWQNDLVYQVLDGSSELNKLPLLKTLLNDNDIRVNDRERTLTRLSRIEDKEVRHQLAEVLLWPGRGISNSKDYIDLLSDYMDFCDLQASLPTSSKEIYPGFQEHHLSSLGVDSASLSTVENDILMQCFVHVATKAILENWSFGLHVANRERLLAVRLRKVFDLPSLLVSSDLLETVWPSTLTTGPPAQRLASWDNQHMDWKASPKFGRRHSAASFPSYNY